MRWDGWLKADARALPLADSCIQCVVTSPPYWGLRDYGSSDQIGLEKTPEEYIEAICDVFSEIGRVLRDNGTVWLNLGDTFWSAGGAGGTMSASGLVGGSKRQLPRPESSNPNVFGRRNRRNGLGLKPKDLIGIPWRVAFALQSDGWYLRSDIIWAKPNPTPESVTDRPTRAHEYIFLLTKSASYFYDHDAIKEPSIYGAPNSPDKIKSPHGQNLAKMDKQRGHSRRHAGFNDRWDLMTKEEQGARGRNKRSVWTVATKPYPEAHYATFPPDLIEPCILAGSKPGDIVLDPFAGSGTTARVSEQHGRRWIACDLAYQDLQLRRLSNVQRQLVVGDGADAQPHVTTAGPAKLNPDPVLTLTGVVEAEAHG